MDVAFKARKKCSLKIRNQKVDPCGHIRIDGPTIVLSGAFCPVGHNLLASEAEPLFDGFPGIKVRITDKNTGKESDVILSPIHGDARKCVDQEPADGTLLELSCPQCGTTLPRLAGCDCPEHGDLVVLYLSQKLDKGSYVAVCNVWGCPKSQIVEEFTLISEFSELLDQ